MFLEGVGQFVLEWGGGGGELMMGFGSKEKSPDFRSPEVGLSAYHNLCSIQVQVCTWFICDIQCHPAFCDMKDQ